MSPSAKLSVSRVQFREAPILDQHAGLLGWVSIELNGALVIADVQVRRTREGREYLAFPSRIDGRGERRSVVRPLTDEARVEIERQVVAELRKQGRLAS
ncbi:MAG: septation protein SpoVG family protein [Planctomycetes bacterium]|nr:septation protein SpoVG family protein [Planctomycetota bacterium]